jgi:hypothetical protein
MPFKITPRTEALVKDLDVLGRNIDGSLLARATPDARSEWRAFLGQLPSDDTLGAGFLPYSDDELAHMVAKVLRFKAILEAGPRAVGRPVRAAA